MWGWVLLWACTAATPPAKPFSVPVMVGSLSRGPATVEVTLDGEVVDPDEAVVAPQISASILAVPARVGQRVEKGELLVEFDGRSYHIALAAAKAALQAAEADVAVREAARDRVRSSTERILAVATTSPTAISEAESEEARLSLAEADAALLAAVAQRGIRAAAVDAASLDAARTRLISPIAGVVSRQDAKIGQRPAIGTPLVSVTASGKLEIVLEAGEAWIGRITEGAPAVVHSAVRPTPSAAGVVTGVVPASSGSGRIQKVRVELSSGLEGLAPGLAVQGVVTVSQLENALQAPRDAIINGSVFVVDGEKVRKVGVGIVHEGRDSIVIEAELAGSEQVVVRGNEALQDGSTISIIGQ